MVELLLKFKKTLNDEETAAGANAPAFYFTWILPASLYALIARQTP